MASGLELTPYRCADFSMSIPQGRPAEAAMGFDRVMDTEAVRGTLLLEVSGRRIFA